MDQTPVLIRNCEIRNASGNGIGVFVLQSQRSFAITDMWSGIVLIGIFGYVFNLLLIVVENRVLAWHHGANTAVE